MSDTQKLNNHINAPSSQLLNRIYLNRVTVSVMQCAVSMELTLAAERSSDSHTMKIMFSEYSEDDSIPESDSSE